MACVSTLCTTVTLGLLISFVFVLLTVVLQQQWPKFSSYAVDDNFEAFFPDKAYEKLQQLPHDARLFKFEGPLHFANTPKFVDTLVPLIMQEEDLAEVKVDGKGAKAAIQPRRIVLDCSAMVFIDTMGLEAISQVRYWSDSDSIETSIPGQHHSQKA